MVIHHVSFLSFRHLGSESSAGNLPDEPESVSPQNTAEIDEIKTIVLGETSNYPGKGSSCLHGAPMRT